MDLLSGLDARRVNHTLSSNLEKESKHWKPIVLKPVTDNGKEMSGFQRDRFATWITSLSAKFRFHSETCGLAIRLMDRVLQIFKIQAKYMCCVAVCCLYIAAKTLEETENIPSTPELVKKSQCGCSFAEITRMEMVILNKLNWDVRHPSAVDFLHTLHAVLKMHYPHLLSGPAATMPSEQLWLSHLMRKMLRCLTSYSLLVFRPSTLALAILSLELETLTPGWLRLLHALQRMTNIGCEQVMQCREAVCKILGHQPTLGYSGKNRHSSSSAPQSKKRKVEHNGSSMEDVFVEAIRRLYEEGESFVKPSGSSANSNGQRKSALRTSCSLEMHQDSEDLNVPINLVGQPMLVN